MDILAKHYYAHANMRFETFKEWPMYHHPRPYDLAVAGFIYRGTGDAVQCFSCHCKIKDWKRDSDPWVEHKKKSPNCDYLEVAQWDIDHYYETAL